MLYITTRDKHDIHTANKTLASDYSSDGGLYFPRTMPIFSSQEIDGLKTKSFNEIFAAVLNSFFSEQSAERDLELFIGRNPVKTIPAGRKILVAQAWHNPEHKYSYIENNIYNKLYKGEDKTSKPTQWLKIVARAALLFAVYGQLLQTRLLHSWQVLDVAVDADDHISVIAAYYAKQMGLPIGKLICGCDETGPLWDFVHLGEAVTGSASEGLLHILERLIHAAVGPEEVKKFLEICQKRGTYRLPEDIDAGLSDAVFCAVVGKKRVADVINSMCRTEDLLLDTCAARSFGAVQDYRSKTGSSNVTLLFSDHHPVLEADFILRATGLSQNSFIDKCKGI